MTPGGSWLTLMPGTVSLNTFEGEDVRFEITATSSRILDKPFNVAVIDSKGVMVPEISLTRLSELSYKVELRTQPAVAGVRSTYLQVRLCEDDPLVCRSPLQGSPWYIPVTVNAVSSAQARERLKLAPAAFDLVTYQGDSPSFTLEAAAPTGFSKPVYVEVADSAGLLARTTVVPVEPGRSFSTELALSPALTVGEHTSSLEVRVCYDFPYQCRSPAGGSPWRVPLKVTVKPGSTLTTLSTIPALTPWSTFNGNAAQNAYIPASFSPAAFSRRWLKPGDDGIVGAPVVDSGKIFTARIDYRLHVASLLATSEANGEELWRYDIGTLADIKSLATGNGRVFVRTSGQDGAFLLTVDQDSGKLISRTRLNTSALYQRAPTVIGDMVYLGHSGGMEKFNAATGQLEWSNLSMNVMTTFWTPTVDAGHAYALIGDWIFDLDTATGSIASRFQDSELDDGSHDRNLLVLGGGRAVAAKGTRLLAFDLPSRTRTWMANASSVGAPVLANDSVYTLGGGMEIEARSAATGLLQWKSAPVFKYTSELMDANIVVTSNLVFVSGTKSTVALDLATRQVVWSYPLGGAMAVSDRGVLHIVSSNGTMVAFNLR